MLDLTNSTLCNIAGMIGLTNRDSPKELGKLLEEGSWIVGLAIALLSKRNREHAEHLMIAVEGQIVEFQTLIEKNLGRADA